MKTLLLSMLAIVLGIALGVGTATLRMRAAPWNPTRDETVKTTATAQPNKLLPEVVVKQTQYDFGTLDMNSSGTHDFVFTNEGKAPLTLSDGGTSCRCTMSTLSKDEIPPGESTKVTIAWKPNDSPGPYQQTAKILTNDPAHPMITLTISGQITTAMRFSPTDLVFSYVPTAETTQGQARLYYYLDQPLKILSHKWSDETSAQYFDATLEPLSAAELKDEPTARSGWLVTVTVKTGLPQGPIRQSLVLQTNLASPTEAVLPIQGTVSSEIAVVGPGWNVDHGVLNLGEVSQSKGIHRKLMLVVRGPLRKDVKFKPEHVAPSSLQVSLGEPTEINKGLVIQTPLTIDIPQGSPPANHLGSEQGKPGEIILQTTHPKVPKLRILVSFAIEG